MAPHTCPKCSSSMEEGFVVDRTHGGQKQSEWAEGPPRWSFWTGISLSGTTRHPVTTWRCTRCGYLESYAVPKADE